MAASEVAVLVEPAWLAERIEDPRVLVMDVRWYLSGKDAHEVYRQGHIPGAHFLNLSQALSAPPGPHTGRHPLPSAEAFAEAARQAGIGRESHVVAYDDMGGAIAGRLWWLLRYFGHERVSLLHGGYPAWVAEGYPVEVGEGGPPPAPGDFEAVARPEMVADLEEVDARRLSSGFLLLDARDGSRYRGEQEPVDARAGHIPGARSAPYSENMQDGRFLDAETLRARYAALGADEAEDIVVYCGSGVTATHDIVALELAGYQARLYPGSWSQWSSRTDLPIATGETPNG